VANDSSQQPEQLGVIYKAANPKSLPWHLWPAHGAEYGY